MTKILIVTERFWPEEFLVNDLAAEWKRQGYGVEVLAQVPSYPFDRVYDGYDNRAGTRVETVRTAAGGDAEFPVHRVSTLLGYNRSVKRKVLNYLHFAWATFRWAVRNGRKFDRVFVCHTAALTMATSVLAFRILWRKPVTIWTQDLWPDAVWGFGFRRTRFRETLLNAFVRLIYACCTRITVSCPGFVGRIAEITGRTAEFVPQWDTTPPVKVEPLEVSEGSPLVFMFAGNLGKPQNLANVIEGFVRASLENAELWIVGGGVMLEELSQRYGGVPCVCFKGRQPRTAMPGWFAKASALIISLTDDYSLTLPGKFQSYIRTGRPILGFIGGATRDLIANHRLGWTADPDDVGAIAEAYRCAARDLRSGEGRACGERGIALSESSFNRERLVRELFGKEL